MPLADSAIVVNVRMGSTRLPGKALRPIGGRPMLGWLIERLRACRSLERIVVATSTLAQNDAIAAFCAEQRVACFRGSEDDVLARTVGALQSVAARIAVNVFGDGPLVDPGIVEQMLETFRRAQPPYDFVGNDLKTTYPPGMEVEVFAVAALADAEQRCTDPRVREHSTLYLRQNPQRYRLLNVEAPAPLRRPDLLLEVDTETDLQVLQALTEHFAGRTDFTLQEIIGYLDGRPDLAAVNRDVPRRWKAFRRDS